MQKPSVVLTRTENDPHGLAAMHPNIEWIDFPLIKFDYQQLSAKLIQKVEDKYDWLIFTSQNGVKSFFEQAPNFISKKIACVGPKTAALVTKLGHEVTFVPSVYTSMTLASELPITPKERICYVGGNLSSFETLQVLKSKTEQFMQIESYHTISQSQNTANWSSLFKSEPTIISFCSPSAVTSYSTQLEKHPNLNPAGVRMAAIGTTTASAIKDDLGMTAIIGEKHTFASMIDKIVETIADDTQT